MLALVTNGAFMLIAVYWPQVFGDGIWSRIVFTVNFIAVMMTFGGLVSRGVL
ncbi:hypothetical protein [Enterobacter phage vB_ExiM_F5M1E]|nr:hypothetical protein [Enterobacter phage vB_ExiM_F1M1E]UNA02994.1 hypothetical protein [Enterobacter phage vB_ExiM_F2M1E]UNA03315.1 hypothetical protein [Enterobacter phage vB_ExiM_F4M1E]UNA03636.1 hypothetical protein [Enterobacter phage vB_ExiM_F5M1E]UNA03956.1 hypothetical protein [Pantoea phage vB_PdiM_F5M2A]